MGTSARKMARTLRMVSPSKINFDPAIPEHLAAVKDQVLGFGRTLSDLRFFESVEEIKQLILLDLYKETQNEKNDFRWFANPAIVSRTKRGLRD